MSVADKDEPPPLGVGHIHLIVSDVKASRRFYERLGLRPLGGDESLSILELRGGTHLLLFRRGAEGAPQSHSGAGIDLMIAGRTREALESFRTGIVADGIAAEDIPDQRFFGHHLFHARDPDGHEVTVYTSHASDLPV